MRKVAFLLLPNFQMLGIISAMETLRVANSLYPEQRAPFSWVLVHDTEPVVPSSSGLTLTADLHINDLSDFDALIVCSSVRHKDYENVPTQNLIRRFDRYGKIIGSMESGVYHIARAGVLDGHPATAHYNNLPLFAQLFPAVRFAKRIYTASERRLTCAGGSSSIDMMLHVITENLGSVVAAKVANTIIYPYRPCTDLPQDDVFTATYNGLQSTVRTACRIMEASISQPVSIEQIAEEAGVSRRHLDRLFLDSFSCTSAEYYRTIRLSRAQKLIKGTKLDFSLISSRCGFSSYSHFLKRYRESFGVSPTEDRSSRRQNLSDPSKLSPRDDLHPFQKHLDPLRMI